MIHSEDSSGGQTAVEQLFTKSATDYARFFLPRRTGSNFCFRERLALAAEITNSMSGRLLDCACGTGEITAAILASGRFTSGTIVDLSPTMLETARQRIQIESKELTTGRLEFISSDVFEFATQRKGQTYDLILCLGLIAHTGRLDDLLGRLQGLLSPNGRILLQTTLLDHLGTKLVRTLTHQRYYRQHGYRISYFRHPDIICAAKIAGLRAVEVRRFTLGIPFGDRVWAGMNYFLEKSLQNWTRLYGAEGMYLLRRNSYES